MLFQRLAHLLDDLVAVRRTHMGTQMDQLHGLPRLLLFHLQSLKQLLRRCLGVDYDQQALVLQELLPAEFRCCIVRECSGNRNQLGSPEHLEILLICPGHAAVLVQ